MLTLNRRNVLALALLALLGAPLLASASATERLLVIVSKDQNEVSAALLRNIYLGKVTFWPDGSPVQAYGRPLESPAGTLFLQSVLHMTPVRFKHHWASLKLSGQAMDVPQVSDPRQLGARVAANKGAISYLLESEARGLDSAQVRLIPVSP